MSNKGNLIVISAPSGSGKTSLALRVLQRVPGLEFSVSHTTRQPRPGERHGVEYYFVPVGQFEEMIEAGEFLEHARVHGNYYGTGVRFVQERLEAGVDVLLDIDVQGARQVKAARPDVASVFILPPSPEVLEERLRQRAQDSSEAIDRRLEVARQEIRSFEEYDFLVVNDDLETSARELQSIVLAVRCRTAVRRERAARIVARFGR